MKITIKDSAMDKLSKMNDSYLFQIKYFHKRAKFWETLMKMTNSPLVLCAIHPRLMKLYPNWLIEFNANVVIKMAENASLAYESLIGLHKGYKTWIEIYKRNGDLKIDE